MLRVEPEKEYISMANMSLQNAGIVTNIIAYAVNYIVNSSCVLSYYMN